MHIMYVLVHLRMHFTALPLRFPWAALLKILETLRPFKKRAALYLRSSDILSHFDQNKKVDICDLDPALQSAEIYSAE